MALPEYTQTTDELFSRSSEALTQAINSAYRIAGNAKPTLRETRFNLAIDPINLDAPPKFSDLFDGADNANAIVADLNDKVDAWLAKYFPSINGQFQNVPEDWLVGVISGTKPFGIDSTIFDLVWHKARDRAYRTTHSEQRTLETNFSLRGFTLPSGALVDAIAQSEQRATDAILDVNRDEAIKDADIKNDILKYAVGIASQLKQGILSTSAEFFKAYYNVYGLDNDTARIRAQAYQAYYNALASFYGVEVSWEELRLRAENSRTGVDSDIDKNRISVFSVDGAASAHAQASRGFADISAAAASAAGTLVASVETA